MGRKVHPIGFRLNINKPWLGRWYAEGDKYVDQLQQDLGRHVAAGHPAQVTNESGGQQDQHQHRNQCEQGLHHLTQQVAVEGGYHRAGPASDVADPGYGCRITIPDWKQIRCCCEKRDVFG